MCGQSAPRTGIICFINYNYFTVWTSFPRVIYKRLWGYELKDKKRTETALKVGEDRAILLGLGMVFSSVMMYFVICITMVRTYAER